MGMLFLMEHAVEQINSLKVYDSDKSLFYYKHRLTFHTMNPCVSG
jgi:hypothetical protein